MLQTLNERFDVSGQRDWDLKIDAGKIVLAPTAAGINQAQGMAMDFGSTTLFASGSTGWAHANQ